MLIKNKLSDTKVPKLPKSLINELQQRHPNWNFTILETGLSWNEVIKNLKNSNYEGPVTLELCYRNEYLEMSIEEFYKKGYELGNKLSQMFEGEM